jgi:hypothetical protein
MIRHGPGRFHFHQSERRWPSVIVSVGITALSFALAFGSMWSIPGGRFSEPSATDAIATLQLPTPAPPKPKVVAPPRVAKQPPAEIDRREIPNAPAVIPPSVDIPAPVVSPLPTPVGTPTIGRDGTVNGTNAATDTASRGSGTARRSGKGASMEPAGISLANRAANTTQVRDSIMRSKMTLIPGLAATRAPTGRELAELEQSQRSSLALRRRTLTGGNSNDLVILQGKGMNGVGAVDPTPASGIGFGVSVPFTLFSSGPTREQRRKDEAIYADNQLRERRLEDRMFLKRDSIRADSVRADSLRAELLRADSLRRRSP